jgi:predicted permease
VLFGLWPAVGAVRMRLRDALQESGDTTFTGAGRLNRMLVVTQVAVACLLSIGAALMLTTLGSLLTIDVGMRIDRVAAARLNLPAARYTNAPARAEFVQSVLARLRSAPGVEEAAAINTLPLAGESGLYMAISPEGGRSVTESGPLGSPYLIVSPGYFRAMGIPLVRGRDLAWTDHADAPVAVINRTLAQRLWPGEDALGKRLTVPADPALRTVVGIVEDARFSDLAAEVAASQRATDAVGPQVYLPIQVAPQNYVAVVARSGDAGNVSALPAQIRAAVSAVDPTLPVYAAQSMEALVAETIAPQRVNTLLVGAFGALALCLAAIGVYGLLACSVAQRRREIGVRMALGAERRDVLILVIRQGLRLVGAGIVLGLAAATATTRYLQEMLYGVTPRDPATFATVALVLIAVGIVASFAPALRAATVDPLATLRND